MISIEHVGGIDVTILTHQMKKPRHREKGLELVRMADFGRVGIQPTGILISKSASLTTSCGFHSEFLKVSFVENGIEILQSAC